MRIKIIYNLSWLFYGKWWGITLYPFILFKYTRAETKDYVLRHELEHMYQVRRYGWWKFYIRWLYQRVTKGYYEIDYEIEAYDIQHTPLTDRERFIKENGGED